MVDCDNWLLDFGASQANGLTAANLIRANHLRYMGFVGRPNAPMRFWVADPAFQPVTQVSLNDPWAPCIGDTRFITYDAYVQLPNNHTHWDDFSDIAKGGH